MIKINKPKLPLRQVIGIGLSLFFLITLWGANRWANYRQIFEVQEIAISGYEILDKENYQDIVDQFDIRSIHDVKMQKIAETIEANPFVKAARVSRRFPNQITINIVERKPLAILNMDSFFMLDGEAVVLPDHEYSQNARSLFYPVLIRPWTSIRRGSKPIP